MDTLSHGLWGGISFGRNSKKLFILAFLFGALPDVVVFGWEFVQNSDAFFGATPPPLEFIPNYIFGMYNITHSLIVGLVVSMAALFLAGRSALPILAWPLHVLFDIFSHSAEFFPTPFLWPFQTPFFDGIPWVVSWVFWSNWALIIILYGVWFITRKGNKKNVLS